MKKVAEALGHTNVSITLNTYSHFIPTIHDEVAEVMEEITKEPT